jgi:phosphoribosylformylglycinamidine synthase PurS subunit
MDVMYRAEVIVTLKPGVLDPQGKAVGGGLAALGYGEVSEVRVGKFIELRLQADDAETARRRVEEMGRRLLANPVIEDFRVRILEG